ncbi:MAG: hypothetical protein AUK31_05260 [Fibrobacteres bacterium CG2_30_45_31]|nr:MAG: hypothetical protein AUK31_05260 [Fibrobacteres bacterium CG2_30_45_31]
MKKLAFLVIGITLLGGISNAQDSLYIYHEGLVVNKLATDGIDSMVFYNAEIYGNLTDVENNHYKTVVIGTQTWMAANLRVTKYNDGTAIPLVTDSAVWTTLSTGAYCTYNNTVDADTINSYGRLYNWFAVNTGKLCPTGWHAPNDSEWTTLNSYVGVTYGSVPQALAATTGWAGWPNPGSPGDNLSANNISGFSALPGGYRNWTATYGAFGTDARWWVTTEINLPNAYLISMSYFSKYLDIGGGVEKRTGVSVRCLKD